MAVDQKTRAAVQEALLRQQPLMDVVKMEKELVVWLADLKFPGRTGATSWDDCIRCYPADENEQLLDSGRRLRMALQLYTSENQYVVSLIENLHVAGRGTYSICVHVNWKADEWEKQRAVERNYTGKFDDLPKAKHIIWAQSFRNGDLSNALNACAIAILGNELTASPPAKELGQPLPVRRSGSFSFPAREDD